MEFTSLVITAQGQALLAKLVEGVVLLNFTSIKTTDTVYTQEQLANLTELQGVKQSVNVESVVKATDTSVRIRTLLNNTGLETGYTLNTIGVYANDPDDGEILFAASKATSGGYMPPETGTSATSINFDFIITVANANTVNLAIDPAGTATLQDLQNLTDDIASAQDTADKALPKSGGAMDNTDKVENLNADLLDGKHGSEYAGSTHVHGSITTDGKVGTAADLLLGTGTGGLVVAKTAQQAADIISVSNPNILHNWDFRNPINQRNVTNPVPTGYTIDRWTINVPNHLEIVENGIKIGGVSDARLVQPIEFPNLFRGKTVTLSAVVEGLTGSESRSMRLRVNGNSWHGICGLNNTGLNTTTVTLPDEPITDLAFVFYIYGGSSVTISRVKLEIGTVSTLHLDPPMDWTVELPKCQRFFQKTTTIKRYRFVNISNDKVQSFFPFNYEMRVNPTISNVVYFVRQLSSGVNQSGFTLDTISPSSDGFLLTVLKAGHGLSDGIIIVNSYEASADP